MRRPGRRRRVVKVAGLVLLAVVLVEAWWSVLRSDLGYW
jgi:hypothetical protein